MVLGLIDLANLYDGLRYSLFPLNTPKGGVPVLFNFI